MLLIPEVVWEEMLRKFAVISADVRRVAYLDGTVSAANSAVTTVTIPNARLQQHSAVVGAAAIAQATKHLQSYGLFRIALVVTRADSRTADIASDGGLLDAATSVVLVLPYHGMHGTPPHNAGVHVRQSDGWRQLSNAEVQKTVVLVPSVLDFRSCLPEPATARRRSKAA